MFMLPLISKSFSKTNRNGRLIWVSVFFLAYLSVGLSIYQDYGVSWDEPESRKTGMVSAKYLSEIFVPEFDFDSRVSKLPSLKKFKNRHNGVAFELPVSVIEILLGLDDSRDIFLFRHLATFLVVFFWCVCCFSSC